MPKGIQERIWWLGGQHRRLGKLHWAFLRILWASKLHSAADETERTRGSGQDACWLRCTLFGCLLGALANFSLLASAFQK